MPKPASRPEATDNRAAGVFLRHPDGTYLRLYEMTDEQRTEWRRNGVLGKPEPDWTPDGQARAGDPDFPSGFILGWTHGKSEGEDKVADDESAERTYRIEVQSAVVKAIGRSKSGLDKTQIARAVRSDYPVEDVMRALSALVKSGVVQARVNWTKGLGYRRAYIVVAK